MIVQFAAGHAHINLTIVVFGISFISFLASLIWIGIVSRKYIKYCKEIPHHDD